MASWAAVRMTSEEVQEVRRTDRWLPVYGDCSSERLEVLVSLKRREQLSMVENKAAISMRLVDFRNRLADLVFLMSERCQKLVCSG